jgi:predicted dinucleotide-binding enzyme
MAPTSIKKTDRERMGRLRFTDAHELRLLVQNDSLVNVRSGAQYQSPTEQTMHPSSLFSARTRRRVIAICLSVGLVLMLPGPRSSSSAAEPASAPLKIGIIGTGRIGGALARHWIAAGHEVFVSSRHPEELQALVAELGPHAHAGTPLEAATFGTVILVSVPYAAMPQIGADLRTPLAGKVILDTSNPNERRDGPMAVEAQGKGAGIATAGYLHSRRIVRAFNCIPAATLAHDGNRQPERIAIPLGSDDSEGLKIAERLVRDAGFDPVVVGSLAATRVFDLGQPLATGSLTAKEMRGRIHD